MLSIRFSPPPPFSLKRDPPTRPRFVYMLSVPLARLTIRVLGALDRPLPIQTTLAARGSLGAREYPVDCSQRITCHGPRYRWHSSAVASEVVFEASARGEGRALFVVALASGLLPLIGFAHLRAHRGFYCGEPLGSLLERGCWDAMFFLQSHRAGHAPCIAGQIACRISIPKTIGTAALMGIPPGYRDSVPRRLHSY